MMQVSEQVKDVIDYLADKLKVPAEVVWTALLRQAQIVGWPMVVGFSLVEVVLVGLYIWVIKKVRDINDEYGDWEGMWFTGSIATVAFLLLTMGTTSLIIEGVTALLNPEYWAIKKVLEMIK